MLLILLLASTGQAASAPCAADVPNSDTEIFHPEGSGAHGAHQNHCLAMDSAENCGANETEHGDCEQPCNCCPGHCASALPVSDRKGSAPLRNTADSRYAEIQSSPLPEMALRPPINR